MPELPNTKRRLSTVEALERDLNLKQLQINRLLNITQAINNNVSATGLFDMYVSFLSWEMGIKKMALYFREEEGWKCLAQIGLAEKYLNLDPSGELRRYRRLQNLEASEHPILGQFDIVIPVFHKNEALSYVLIGGFEEDEDMYSKVQFITTITNIIAVAIENKRLFKQQIEQEGLRLEMELARQAQQLFIPKSLPNNEVYELASIYKPKMSVGGDYFDYIEIDACKFVFCIADISGKGVGAALVMANFQAIFHSLLRKQTDLDQFVRALNSSVQLITKGEKFITLFVARYDRQTRTLTYVNAGHNPPVLIMGGKVQRLTAGSTILGHFDRLPSLEVGTVAIPEEALILTFTDGLTDMRNPKGVELDEEYGIDFLLKHYKLSAEEVNQKMMDELQVFTGGGDNFPDDFTVLTCKIK